MCLGLGLAGCSQPLLLFRGSPEPEAAVKEPTTTGSIEQPKTFGPDLNGEDWRRAHAALTVALDPQGNGRPVKWDNPDTGLYGSVNPTGLPFVSDDRICRNFLASVVGSEKSRFVRGTGCKPSGGEWSLQAMHRAPAPTSSMPKASAPKPPGGKGKEAKDAIEDPAE